MAENSGIAWTDHTWNPWQGCRKVSLGCTNCYMYTEKKRFGQDPTTVIRSTNATFNKPNAWKEPALVFVCSWSDFFIEDADEWRPAAWDIIKNNPNLTFQILTKRPENILSRLPAGWPFDNVWLGVTAEDQESANERVPILISIPAAVRFVSVEPMIGPVSLKACWAYLERSDGSIKKNIDWVICGGESGSEPRYMSPFWAAALMADCSEAGIAFFMKQMSGASRGVREEIPGLLYKREFPGGLVR